MRLKRLQSSITFDGFTMVIYSVLVDADQSFCIYVGTEERFCCTGVSRERFWYFLTVHDFNVNLSHLMVLHKFYVHFRLTSIGPFAMVLALKSDICYKLVKGQAHQARALQCPPGSQAHTGTSCSTLTCIQSCHLGVQHGLEHTIAKGHARTEGEAVPGCAHRWAPRTATATFLAR